MSAFTTSVSEVTAGTVNLRGYSLRDVMEQLSYAEGAFLCITGRLPAQGQRRVLDTVLNSLLDHGFVASTVSAARFIASGNPSLVPAVAGGLLACGENTVSPEESFAVLERAATLRGAGHDHDQAARHVVEELRAAGKRIPGLGHPTHKDGDFRADVLFDVAAESGVAGDGVEQIRAVHRQFLAITNKTRLPINIDGALAAVCSDLGMNARQTAALAMVSVLPGVVAHVIEELEDGVPLRHIANGVYEVPDVSPLPPPGE